MGVWFRLLLFFAWVMPVLGCLIAYVVLVGSMINRLLTLLAAGFFLATARGRVFAAIKAQEARYCGAKLAAGVTMSSIPCLRRNSAVWKSAGSFCLIVCSITRGPAKPINAPGSAITISAEVA